jgi:hypothetical protein
MSFKIITDIRIIRNGFTGYVDRVEIKTLDVKQDLDSGFIRQQDWAAKESDWKDIEQKFVNESL